MITSVVRTPLAWVAAAGLLLAGCSSTSSGAVSAAPLPTTSAAAVPAPAAVAPTSVGGATGPGFTTGNASRSTPTGTTRLAAIPLHSADLPDGYTSTPYQDDSSSGDSEEAALVACVGGRDTSGDSTADANSPTFTKGGLQISSNATKYKSQSDVDADIAIFKSPKINACFNSFFKKSVAGSLPAGVTIDSVNFKMTTGAAGGPDNVVGTGFGKIIISAGRAKQQVYISVAFITGPLIEAEVDFTSVGALVTSTVQADLVAKVAKRAAAAS